jgi:hypothetical protein
MQLVIFFFLKFIHEIKHEIVFILEIIREIILEIIGENPYSHDSTPEIPTISPLSPEITREMHSPP